MSLERLIDRYCSVWTETDPAARAAVLDAIWADSGTYTDPTIANLAKPELLAHIARVVASRPGARLLRTTAVDEHHGLIRFGFKVVRPDGTILRHGTDFVRLDAARVRIQEVIGFFGDLAPAGDR